MKNINYCFLLLCLIACVPDKSSFVDQPIIYRDTIQISEGIKTIIRQNKIMVFKNNKMLRFFDLISRDSVTGIFNENEYIFYKLNCQRYILYNKTSSEFSSPIDTIILKNANKIVHVTELDYKRKSDTVIFYLKFVNPSKYEDSLTYKYFLSK